MLTLLKRRWKQLVVAGIVVVLIVLIVSALRVLGFVNDTFQTQARVSAFSATPTPDVQATVTAQAHLKEVAAANVIITNNTQPTTSVTTFSSTTTTTMANYVTTMSATEIPTSTPTAIAFDPNMSLVQHLHNGQRLTLMYLGYGGTGHSGAYLTDTILVLSIDPKTKTISEFNVPRDLYVPVQLEQGNQPTWAKINSVFATIMDWSEPNQNSLDPKYRWTDSKTQLESAANLTADTVEQVLGIPIDAWVTMDFNGFRSLINALGGVDVCVERPFTDNQYPANDDDQVDASVITIHFDAGCQHMDGETAIRFARSRHSQDPLEGGDFARSRRQMQVIDALRQKVTANNLFFKFLDILGALDNNIHTSLTFDQAKSLLGYIQSSEGKQLQQDLKFDPEIISTNLVTDSTDPQFGYILQPLAGQGNFKDIQQWVQLDFQHLDLRREQAWVQVLNCSGKSGVDDRLSSYLLDQGFHVDDSATCPVQSHSVLYDFTGGTALNNIATLKKMLPNLTVVSKPSSKKPYTNAPDLMLYIGADYQGVAG